MPAPAPVIAAKRGDFNGPRTPGTDLSGCDLRGASRLRLGATQAAARQVRPAACGAPLETSEGWLLLTHGVGPKRQYCMGAMLLDLEDPLKVIGTLDEPLIMPTETEREGYVPNVVYSCGGMIHGDKLIIPYAISDMVTTFASINLPELLDHLAGQST